ncbi:MAG: HEPN domain-containing protein [Chlorobi bacterium]|nr:HEPN domain-containing protein [Chlorobiota bacterium]
MKEDAKQWIKYSEENLEAAKILLDSNLYNPALFNIQQSIEKSLKSLFIEYGIKLKKTHSIGELKNILSDEKIYIELEDDECDFLDSIYLPTKYPVGSVLPDFSPDYEITKDCLTIAQKVFEEISDRLTG